MNSLASLPYSRRREIGPWFAAGRPLDGEEIYRCLSEYREDQRWLEPYTVYVHVPFCTTICRYCALYTTRLPRQAGPVLDGYLE